MLSQSDACKHIHTPSLVCVEGRWNCIKLACSPFCSMMKDNNSLQYNMLPVHGKVMVSIRKKDHTRPSDDPEKTILGERYCSINKLILYKKTAKKNVLHALLKKRNSEAIMILLFCLHELNWFTWKKGVCILSVSNMKRTLVSVTLNKIVTSVCLE